MNKPHKRVIKFLKNEKWFILCLEIVIYYNDELKLLELENITNGVEITFYY